MRYAGATSFPQGSLKPVPVGARYFCGDCASTESQPVASGHKWQNTKAEYQELDENPPKIRPIVNINQRGEMIFKMQVWYDPAESQEDYSGIDNLLTMFKNDIVKDTEPFQSGPNLITLVNDPILIRADKWTEWHYIAKLMERCSLPTLAFWKLELAMSEEDKEDRLLKSQGRR